MIDVKTTATISQAQGVTPKEEELFSQVEAEQSLIIGMIDENRKLAAHSDALINCARRQAVSEDEGAAA